MPSDPDPRLRTRTYETPVAVPHWNGVEAWRERAQVLRRQVLAAAGLWRDPAETDRPLPAFEIYERREHPEFGYAVEKFWLESLPGHLVTGNLYRPAGAAAAGGPARRPGVLNPHGHCAGGRLHHDAHFSTAMRCITLARMGYVACSHDMVGYGDSLRTPHRWGDARSWLWGATPLGLQLWNSLRALDFLAAQPDVDPQRLGCTGESGGATQTLLLTAVDERVRVAAPVCMVSAHMQGGCVCENAPGLRLGTSNVELAALCAPRPLCLVSATGDWTVNSPRLEFPAIAAIYAGLGVEQRVTHSQFEAPHNYNHQSRAAVYAFLARWLPTGADARVLDEADVPGPDPAADLRVFARRAAPTGPEGEAAVAAVVDHWRTQAGQVWASGSRAVEEVRRDVLPWLQAVCGVQDPTAADVTARKEGDTWRLRRRRGGASLTIQPGAGDGRRPVLVAADGRAWSVDAFGAVPDDRPWARAGRMAASEFFLCYNRADAAEAAADLLLALAWLGGRAAVLRAGGTAVAPALLVRAIAGGAIGRLELDLDAVWAAEDSALAWLEPGAYLPGVLRAGGLDGLLALGAPAAVRLRGPGAAVLRAESGLARAIYAAAGAADALRVDWGSTAAGTR